MVILPTLDEVSIPPLKLTKKCKAHIFSFLFPYYSYFLHIMYRLGPRNFTSTYEID